MNMVKPDPSYEKKIVCWCGGEPEQAFVDALNNVAKSYEKWGHADASKGKTKAQNGFFTAAGKLVFPDDEDSDMAEATAGYMKLCYMDGYLAGSNPGGLAQ